MESSLLLLLGALGSGALASLITSWFRSRSSSETVWEETRTHTMEELKGLLEETSRAHKEAELREVDCLKRVEGLERKNTEFEYRLSLNEQFHTELMREAEVQRLLKHKTLSALTVSEGTLDLIKNNIKKCTCGALELVEPLIENRPISSRKLLEENIKPSWVEAQLRKRGEELNEKDEN